MVKASGEAQYEVIDLPAGGPVKPPPLPTDLRSVQPHAGTKSTSTENVGSATPGYLHSNLSKEDIDKMGEDTDFGAGQTTVIPLPTAAAKKAKKAKAEKKTKSKESNSREDASNPKQKACMIVSSAALVLCLAGAITSAIAIGLKWNID